MFKLNVSKIRKKLTRANIEKELELQGWNEFDLASHYIKGFKAFNQSITSDLRSDDKNKSLIARIQNNKLSISDFGYKTGMNIYNYLLEKHFMGMDSSFINVLNMIRNDFKLENIERLDRTKSKIKPFKHNKVIKNTSLSVKIEVKRRRNSKGKIQWNKKDIEYWNSFGISISKLEEKGIAPLEMFWVTNFNKDGIRIPYNVKNELCYVYPFFRNKDGFFMYKIYLPKGFRGDPDFKWISNVNKKVIQNIQHIPKSGDLLIIQSSYKDIMLMEEINPNLNIIAPNGEGIWFKEEVWNILRRRWKNIILFANNDFTKEKNPGLVFARRHSKKYNIPFICTPDNTASDISDFYKDFGETKTKELIEQYLDNINLIT